jgi:hypothetical protein
MIRLSGKSFYIFVVITLFCIAGRSGSAQVVAYDETISFPTDAGVINVKSAPYNAQGDGLTDDTAALTAAIRDSGTDLGVFFWQDKIVYLPNGTYKISATLMKKYAATNGYASGFILVGQSKTGTVIKLADNATGFGASDPIQPMILTTSKGVNGATNTTGNGTDAYRNSIENLTVDVGSGNPHATGISYLANNVGSIRNVVVTAPLNSGATGIDMTRGFIGPALIQNVNITGFDLGIDVGNTEYGVTLEHLSLSGQRNGAVRNASNMLAVSYLETNSSGPAIINSTANGLVVLYNSNLQHSGAAPILIQNTGAIAFHNTTVSNSQSFTGSTASPVEGKLVGSSWTATALPWNITAVDTPVAPYDDSSTWVAAGNSSADFTNGSGNVATPLDATASIQTALDSGASTVYFPHGIYYITTNLNIPATVKRIVGMNSTIRVLWSSPSVNWNSNEGMFHVGTPASDPLVVERIAFDKGGTSSITPYGIDLTYDNRPPTNQQAVRDVVMRDVVTNAAAQVFRQTFGGRLFMEDTCCGGIRLNGSALVAARQFDSETKGYGNIRVINAGSPFWVLGLKTEAPVNVIDGSAGSATQIIGGLLYTTPGRSFPTVPATTCAQAVTPTPAIPAGQTHPNSTPAAFILSASWLQASFVEEVLTFSSQDPQFSRYPWYVADTESGATTCTSNSVGLARTGTQPSTLVENGFILPDLKAGPSTPPTLPGASNTLQTINFPSVPNVVYGAAPIALQATASSNLSVTYTVTGPAVLSGQNLTITGAGAVTVTANQSGNSSYAAASPVAHTFTVAPAVLTISAQNLSMAYGAALPTLLSNFIGFVNGDSVGVVTGAPALATTAASTSPVGAYTITIAQGTLAATNYNFVLVNGVLDIFGGRR